MKQSVCLVVSLLMMLDTISAAQLEITSGKPAFIQCPAPDDGASVIWLHPNGTKVIPSGSNFKIEESTLVIHNVTDMDAGDFICVVPSTEGKNNFTIGYPVRLVVKEPVVPYWQQHAENAGYAFLAAFTFLAVCTIVYLTHRYSWNRRHKLHSVENGGTTDNGHPAPVVPVMEKGHTNPAMEVEAEETVF